MQELSLLLITCSSLVCLSLAKEANYNEAEQSLPGNEWLNPWDMIHYDAAAQSFDNTVSLLSISNLPHKLQIETFYSLSLLVFKRCAFPLTLYCFPFTLYCFPCFLLCSLELDVQTGFQWRDSRDPVSGLIYIRAVLGKNLQDTEYFGEMLVGYLD